MEGIYGQVSDLEIQAARSPGCASCWRTTLAKHSGRTPEQVRLDIERDKILTAEEAKEYGIVDEIIQSRKLSGGLSRDPFARTATSGTRRRPPSTRRPKSGRSMLPGERVDGYRHDGRAVPGAPDGTGVCTHGTHR